MYRIQRDDSTVTVTNHRHNVVYEAALTDYIVVDEELKRVADVSDEQVLAALMRKGILD